MAELRADSVPTDNPNTTRRPGKPPVKIPSHGSSAMDAWQQCCPHASQRKLPKSGPQTTILHAAHAYEGVAYNRLFRREMLAKKDLNWSRSRIPDSTARPLRGGPNATLSASTASPRTTGRGGLGCPHNPNTPFLGWFQGTPLPQEGPQSQLQSLSAPQLKPGGAQEVCWNFNGNQCQFTRCRYLHICSDSSGPHAAIHCPHLWGAEQSW